DARCRVDYAVIFITVVAVLVVEVGGHELTRRLVPRRPGTVVAVIVAYALACAPVFVLYACRGAEGSERFYGVAEVLDGSDATGKLEPGDRILAVDGTAVRAGPSSPPLAERGDAARGAPLNLTIRPDPALRDSAQPRRARGRWLLGIRIEMRVDPQMGRSMPPAVGSPIDRTELLVRDILAGGEADPGGPTRMVEPLKLATEPAWARGLSGGALAA